MALTNYWWQLIWIFVAGGLLAYFYPKRKELVLGETKIRWNIFPAIVLVIPLVIWTGFRTDIFGDTAAYRDGFMDAPSSLAGLISYVQNTEKDQGFAVFTALIKSIFGNSAIVYFLIIAIFQLSCIVYFYRKYSNNYWLSIFVFVAATDYMSWMHNGIRQFLAVSITLVSISMFLKKKYVISILLILLAATFHASALLMLPGLFILQGKAWNKKTVLVLIAALIAILMIDRFTGILETLLSDTQYSNAVSTWETMGDNGTSPIRVLVYSIPTILSIIGLKWIRKEDDPMINLAVNAGICTTGIFCISVFSSGIFIGRLPVYFYMISQGILLPWEIEHMFTKRSTKLILPLTIAFYAVYFFYQVYIAWGLG